MTVYYECKKCGQEIETDVDLGEHQDDLPEKCPECGAEIPSEAHVQVEEHALACATDLAMDKHT